MSDTPETTGFDESQFEKPTQRRLIDVEREKYLAAGGTIKKYIPPYQEGHFYHCDVHQPHYGGLQSTPGVTDTLVRKPRPPKKFGKKS